VYNYFKSYTALGSFMCSPKYVMPRIFIELNFLFNFQASLGRLEGQGVLALEVFSQKLIGKDQAIKRRIFLEQD